MPRYQTMYERDDGWCDWIVPEMSAYRMACCSCGAVHEVQFEAIRVDGETGPRAFVFTSMPSKKYRVRFRARMNERATAAKRRKR